MIATEMQRLIEAWRYFALSQLLMPPAQPTEPDMKEIDI